MILYYITDRRQFPGAESARQERLLECVAAASRADVDYIQLREKDLPPEALTTMARAVLERMRESGTGTRLLINSYADVAVAVGAQGVHLPAGGLNAAKVRGSLRQSGGASPVIGASCHTQGELQQAQSDGADFAVFGPVFEKDDGAGVGLERLREACVAAAGWPVLALGGVTTGNAAECIRVGAAGVAGIRLFQSGDVGQTVAKLRAISG